MTDGNAVFTLFKIKSDAAILPGNALIPFVTVMFIDAVPVEVNPDCGTIVGPIGVELKLSTPLGCKISMPEILEVIIAADARVGLAK